jgi:hypothetical protein
MNVTASDWPSSTASRDPETLKTQLQTIAAWLDVEW